MPQKASSLNLIGQSFFELASGNKNVEDTQMDKKQTKKQNYTNFKSNLAMMVIYLPVNFNSIGKSIFESESRNKNVDG